MNEYFLIAGALWLFVFMVISIFQIDERNKWGPNAVENFCNANMDWFHSFKWLVIGIIGSVILTVIGGLL